MNIGKVIKEKKDSKEYEIKAWVYRIRNLKDIVFLIMRDSSSILQVVVKDKSLLEKIKDLKIESSLCIKGLSKINEKAPNGIELIAKEIKIYGKGEDFPINKDSTREHLANVRHLWLRSRKMTSILKVRSTITYAIHNYFRSEGFYEFQSPIFQSTQCEGGSELFEVKYFDDVLYLTQTWQLPAEAAIFSLEKIYTIAPTFRAEKSITSRHLTEFWMVEAEMAWYNFEDMIKTGENLIKNIIKAVISENKEELEYLGRDIKDLKVILDKNFPIITYDKALEILENKCNMKVEWGKDLRTIEEEKLTKLYDTPIVVTHYPKKVKAFYMKEDPKNKEVVLGADFLAPEGYGEIIGGSEREEDIESIKRRLIESNEDPKNYEFYLDTRRYGSVPHSGFGLGLERVVRWICKLDTIKDAIAFPRTPKRYYP